MTFRWISINVATIFALAVTASSAADDPGDVAITFEGHVLPILKSKCVRCHGDAKQNAGLSVASGAALFRGGESGTVVSPGKPDDSPLIEMIQDGHMPPKGNAAVTESELKTLRRWITDGAKLPGVPVAASAITQHQIVPLMLLRCTACHGGRRREADLDLRTKAGMLKGGKSGPAVVAGKPDESLLIRRIRSEEMPPRRQLVSVSVKPMESGELKKLEAWIAAGLPESPLGPDVAGAEPDRLLTDADRDFWSFRPPRPVVPNVDGLTSADLLRMGNPIDLFVMRKLRAIGLTLSPEADRITLMRRVVFDLVGLPPTPEDIAEFVNDPRPDAYERLVDRLLASPHYGERWARHWLDVAGYADSEGAQNEDRIRPNMWRYRDYVVRAFNSDKPYDRFLHEQLAGDELADYEHAPVITDEICDNLVATGFLRTAPDRTFANITNFVPDRLEVIADEMQILGSAVLGLTLHCARCHTHKFDPLPQRDYYRLAAALKDSLDEHDWLGPEVRQLTQVTTTERQQWERHEQEITEQVMPLKQQAEAEKDTAAKKTIQDQIKHWESQRKPEPRIRALWSRGDPSPTYLLQRGNYLTAGIEVGPGVLSMLTDGQTPFVVEPPWPGARTTGRRLALARWLTDKNHPLTARVLVNRIWKHHFGAGLVSTLANFGKTGAAPTHPELLDWLSIEFMRRDWNLKGLHRLMVLSNTYRQSSQQSPAVLAGDPDNRLLSRMPLRRLEGEIVRDSLLALAGKLDDTPFGPPADVDVRGDGLVTVKRSDGRGRRSIYVLHRRTKLPTILESFDSPQMGPNCVERGESIVAPQALHLLNNSVVHELASDFARRVQAEAGADLDTQLDRIHQLAYGVIPSPEVRKLAHETLAELSRQWLIKLGNTPDSQQQAADRALGNYCHAILNSAGLVYVD
ncbi:MAG: PSD1 domain-containing protein [Planctomycetes bacterium]|nr:PSD1 domain-containing protein [Planctomycetota bacterium]